jgi:hypothetical protein
MAKLPTNDTQYTTQVRSLISTIFPKQGSHHLSLYHQAAEFFTTYEAQHAELVALKAAVEQCQQQINTAKNKSNPALTHALHQAQLALDNYQESLTSERITRHRFLETIVEEILSLSEGETFEESNRKSAKLLGTIQLLINTESPDVLQQNERSKSLYKAILCLRLLDRLVLDGQIRSPYIAARLSTITPAQYTEFEHYDAEKYLIYYQQVKVPIVMAALLQDIGQFHPDAQFILYGEALDKNPYRTLELHDRKALLNINYQQTMQYLIHGIGVNKYVGDSRKERDAFEKAEKEKLLFIKQLLKSAIKPEKGLGNLLKVPQIYTSIVLSTKPNYNYKLLPQVYQVLYQNAAKGFCYMPVVKALETITGMFPQGYGITFIPTDENGHPFDRFEYAIVTQLYPSEARQALVRTTTRNLTFIIRGVDVVVAEQQNLYFPQTVKSFARITKERLQEILALLASNYKERQQQDVVPRCWHAHEYFSEKNHQNLWNKTV